MGESKFSFAPWKVEERSLSITVRAANGEVIFHESDKRIPRAIADAHLIAAAPEMYEVLETIENDDGQFPSWLWERVQKVLAKARGEQVSDGQSE